MTAECLEAPYTVLADTEQLKAWRCKAPGTTCYASDILITRFGIVIAGDINGLTFSVGLSCGTEFLAGDDISYYIHEAADPAAVLVLLREIDQLKAENKRLSDPKPEAPPRLSGGNGLLLGHSKEGITERVYRRVGAIASPTK